MTPDTASVLTLRTPYDVIGSVPHLLGFVPEQSLVVICLAGRRVRLTMRLDLPERGEENELAVDLAQRAVRALASDVLLVVYAGRAPARLLAGARDALPYRALVRRVTRRLREEGLIQREALLVADDRWWSYTCRVAACCPPTGTPVREPTATVLALAAERVADGASVLASRAELARSIEPVLFAGSPAPHARAPGAPERRLLLDLYAALLDGEPGPDDAARSRVARAMRHIGFRDDVLGWTGRADGPTVVALLVDLCRHVEDVDAAAVCSVLAWAAYQRGNGGLANVAVERALRCEPGYSLALLVAEMVGAQLPPERLQEVADQLPTHPQLREPVR